MCLFASTTVLCSHHLCQQAIWGVVGENELAALLAVHSSVLGEVLRQGQVIATLIERVGKVAGKQYFEADSQAEKQTKDYLFELVLDSTPKPPVMRESSFSLSGFVATSDGLLSSRLSGVSLSLSLYTVDSPPRLLVSNIVGKLHTGKSILRGSVQATIDADGRFSFPKVVINEVSSHYLEDEFTLVVSAEGAQAKPVACRHLNVKVRKKLRRGKKCTARKETV